MKNRSIAIFDFDHTLTKHDSFFYFLLFSTPLYKKILSFSLLPILFLYLFGFISNEKAKENIFSFFFKDIKEDVFNKISKEFAFKKIDEIIRESALKKALWHKNQGHLLIIASASFQNYINPWATKKSFDDVVATKVEVVNGRLTGKFLEGNCFGKKKLEKVKHKFPNIDDYYIYVYTDSQKDNPLLDIADEKFLNKF